MIVFRLFFAVLSTLCGQAALFVFIFLRNYPAAILGFLTGITNGILLCIHILVYKRKLHEWYGSRDLFQIARLGFVVATIGVMFLIYHSVLEIMLKKAILPVWDSNVIPIIWALITLKSGVLLLFYALHYEKHIDESSLLIGDDEERTNSCEDEEQEGNK